MKTSRAIARLPNDRRGSVGLVMALAMPVLIVAAAGAVQRQSLGADKAALQNVSDSAALWGARQLTLNPVGVETRTRAFATAQLQQFGGAALSG